MAYTASITNCTFPSCSKLESLPTFSKPNSKPETQRVKTITKNTENQKLRQNDDDVAGKNKEWTAIKRLG